MQTRKDPFIRAVAVEDPRNDLRMTFLASHFDAAARMRKSAGTTRDELYTSLQAADHGFRLANAELERVREEIEERHAELGLELPVLYHSRDCGCEVCAVLG